MRRKAEGLSERAQAALLVAPAVAVLVGVALLPILAG